jgi:hypothetical protein
MWMNAATSVVLMQFEMSCFYVPAVKRAAAKGLKFGGRACGMRVYANSLRAGCSRMPACSKGAAAAMAASVRKYASCKVAGVRQRRAVWLAVALLPKEALKQRASWRRKMVQAAWQLENLHGVSLLMFKAMEVSIILLLSEMFRCDIGCFQSET